MIEVSYNDSHNAIELDDGVNYICLSTNEAMLLAEKIKEVLRKEDAQIDMHKTSYFNGGSI